MLKGCPNFFFDNNLLVLYSAYRGSVRSRLTRVYKARGWGGGGSFQIIGMSGFRAKPDRGNNSCAHWLQEHGTWHTPYTLKCKSRTSRISWNITPPGAWSYDDDLMAVAKVTESVSIITCEIPIDMAALSAARQASPSAAITSCLATKRPEPASTPLPSMPLITKPQAPSPCTSLYAPSELIFRTSIGGGRHFFVPSLDLFSAGVSLIRLRMS
jgi:hypothetical protein